MRTIAIISQKGGAGKTTLAVHLAVAAQQAGFETVVFDADPQATASQWSEWRETHQLDAPAVIDCASPALLAKKLRSAADLGAQVAIIDTPPHADIMANEACKVADHVIVPCKPQAFDLAAVQTTADLVKRSGKPSHVVFTGGPVRAPNTYKDATELLQDGEAVAVAPMILPMRAVLHHSTGEGRTALETEPGGKAAEEVRILWEWLAGQVGLSAAQESEK